MYLLLKMVIVQPAMLVYQRVPGITTVNFWMDEIVEKLLTPWFVTLCICRLCMPLGAPLPMCSQIFYSIFVIHTL